MSEYVKITTSAADIIAAAQGITARGEGLSAQISAAIGDIESREGDNTLGDDDFGREFKKTYHKPTPAAGGAGTTANEAAKQSARAVGTMASHFGDAVTQAMTDYLTVDGENQAGIESSAE
jgi:hypothetical protein